MRRDLGLAPPEARIGLAAHDFLQAAAAPRAVLSRAVSAEGAPTAPSRWLARLGGLLGGLDAGLAEGERTLPAMRARGAALLARAGALAAPDFDLDRAPRPAPAPPLDARPAELWVTRIETLIRDPYDIYARHVLGLKKLAPIGRPPGARDMGMALHDIMERFFAATRDLDAPDEAALRDALLAAARAGLAETAPWPALRRLWLKRMERVAPWFAAREARRREEGATVAIEAQGAHELALPGGPFTLRARADRIDRLHDGRLAIYDYKSGTLPGVKEIRVFAKQLALEGAIAAAGGFEGVEAAPIAALEYIGLSGSGEGGAARAVDLAENAPDRVWAEFAELIEAWRDPARGYRARLRPKMLTYQSDYDHLSRFGEWTDAGEEEE